MEVADLNELLKKTLNISDAPVMAFGAGMPAAAPAQVMAFTLFGLWFVYILITSYYSTKCLLLTIAPEKDFLLLVSLTPLP